jgi:hypothetical protein
VVVDEKGNPNAGVLIQACSAVLCVPARTDGRGSFTLRDLPAGSYEIDFSLPAAAAARVRFFDHARSITVGKIVWRSRP